MADPRSPARTPAAAGARRRWTLRRLGMWALCLLLGALIAGELGARYIVGLGDPPLYKLDPEIEYLLVPNQKCRRFGHDYNVNAWSMRSSAFPEKKSPGEFRVMVLGDSIVNGGSMIDQRELATERLQSDGLPKSDRAHKSLIVGNMSAGSWGPPNELACAKRFGLFDADLLIIVLNSDDVADVPGLEYIGSAWPQHKPMLALQELIGVYGWKAVCRVTGWRAEPPPPAHTTTREQDVDQCRKSFADLVDFARAKGARVALVQFLKQSELRAKPQPGYDAIRQWAEQSNIPIFSTAEIFKPELDRSTAPGPFLSGDDIHLSPRGQELLAQVLQKAVEGAISDSSK